MDLELRRLGNLIQQNTLWPCELALVENKVLTGLPVIDGVQVVSGARVLVVGQNILAENGIYIARLGQWNRSTDWNEATDVTSGSLIAVIGGDEESGLYQGVFPCPLNVGSTPVTFINLTKRERAELIHRSP